MKSNRAEMAAVRPPRSRWCAEPAAVPDSAAPRAAESFCGGRRSRCWTAAGRRAMATSGEKCGRQALMAATSRATVALGLAGLLVCGAVPARAVEVEDLVGFSIEKHASGALAVLGISAVPNETAS